MHAKNPAITKNKKRRAQTDRYWLGWADALEEMVRHATSLYPAHIVVRTLKYKILRRRPR